jgi:Rrf2 family protein
MLVRLAMQDEEAPLRRSELAEQESLSVDYIEQIMMKLKAAGLVRSRRGAKGGFLLGRDAGGITVEEILLVTEGPIELAPCRDNSCVRAQKCPAQPVWEEATERMREVFQKTTVQSLVEKYRKNGDSGTAYVI